MALARVCVAFAVLAGPGLARAAGSDAATGARLSGARETRCTLAVRLDGPIATMTELHELVAGGEHGLEGTYAFAVPPGAAVIDARVTPPGRRESRAVAVSMAALQALTPDAAGLAIPPDLGLVSWVGADDEGDHYEARAAPLDATRPLRLALTWTVPARYVDGRLVLAVPARGSDPMLTACEVTVEARPGAGVRAFGPVFVAGVKLARGGHTTVDSVRPLEVELVPTWTGTHPIAASAALPLPGVGNTRTLTTVAVYVPPARGEAKLAPHRLVLVVDTSRSLGVEGRAATATIMDALLAAVPATTPVEVIGFDRGARQLLGAWTPAGQARTTVARAWKVIAPAGGSDLGVALNLVATVVADGEPTRVIIVSDGILPTRLDGAELIGRATMPVSQVTIDAIVPLVPGAPLLARGPLDSLVTAFHGQLVTVRTTELASRAATLSRALATAPPLRELALILDGDPVAIGFPDELRAGDGAIAHVLSRGKPAKQVHLTGSRTAVLGFDAVALPAGTAPIALTALAQDRVTFHDVGALAADELLALGRSQGTVTPQVGFAVLDTTTATGATRAELARSAGLFTRTASPGSTAVAAPGRAVAAVEGTRSDPNLPASTYQYLIKYQLWPQLRACYQDALRGKARFSGTLDLTLELARGEVHDVGITGAMPSQMVACVADAAYAMEVPAYPLAGLAETIAIVHKPIFLRAPPDSDGELGESFGLPTVEPPPSPPLR